MQPGSPRDADLTDNIPGSLGYLRIISGFSGAASARTQNSKCGFLHMSKQTHRHVFTPEKLSSKKKKIRGNKRTGSNSRQAALQQSFNISNPITFFLPCFFLPSFRGTLSKLVKDMAQHHLEMFQRADMNLNKNNVDLMPRQEMSVTSKRQGL